VAAAVAVGATAVRADARRPYVVRVTFRDKRALEISAGHPTADGRTFADLSAGGQLDGRALDTVETVPYTHAFTYDILPGSTTGTYFASGALIGSTLSGEPRR